MADTIFTHGPANVTTLLTTTLEKRRKGKGIQDAVFNEMVLLSYLHDKNRNTEDGGATIVVPLMTAANSTSQFYDGFEPNNESHHPESQYQKRRLLIRSTYHAIHSYHQKRYVEHYLLQMP